MVKDREAWRAAVHGVTKSWTQLNDWTTAESKYLLRADFGSCYGLAAVTTKMPQLAAFQIVETGLSGHQFPLVGRNELSERISYHLDVMSRSGWSAFIYKSGVTWLYSSSPSVNRCWLLWGVLTASTTVPSPPTYSGPLAQQDRGEGNTRHSASLARWCRNRAYKVWNCIISHWGEDGEGRIYDFRPDLEKSFAGRDRKGRNMREEGRPNQGMED